MSIINKHEPDLKKALIKAITGADGLPIVETVNLVLAINQTSIPKIAKGLNVSRQFLYIVLSNPRKSKRVKQALSDALGFDPWGDID